MSLRDDVSVMPQQMHGNNAISLLNGEPHIIFTQGNGGANGMVHEPNGFQPQYMMGEAPLGSQALWERLLASEARISPMRSSASWLPEEPPEPDAPAPAAQSRGNYYAMLSQDFEALTLKRRSEASGLFGVGLQVSDDPPHLVQRVSRLLDRDRRNISDMVAIGDTLYSVNDFQVEMSSIDTVEQLIFGDLGTFVRLTFCNRNRQKYEVVVSRHVPISVWEQERVWYEIKPEFQGRELRCDPSIVHILETIRCLLSIRCCIWGEIEVR